MTNSVRRWVISGVVVLCGTLSMVSQVRAANVEGTSSAIFLNPVPGSAVVTGVGTNFFTWGVGFNSSPSSLGFTGAGFVADFDELFSFGTLTFFNGTIFLGTEATAVDLEVTIMLTMPGGVTQELTQTLTLVNTLNTADPIASADLVFLPTNIPNIPFNVNGVPFTFELRGFGTITGSGGATTIDRFFVLEMGTASAELIGRIVPCSADAGFFDTEKAVPGTGGKKIRYRVNDGGRIADALSIAITLCNPHPEDVDFVVCSMSNRRVLPMDRVDHDDWIALSNGQWTCTDLGTTSTRPPSFHFGCRPIHIPAGQTVHLFDDRGVLGRSNRFPPYIDFLRPLSLDSQCDSMCMPPGAPTCVTGRDQFLVPVSPRADYVNVWAVFGQLRRQSPTLGCTMEWPTGNWFTMGNPDTYHAQLNGRVLDAPTGSVLTFRFPLGSPELERTFVVPPANPDNPTCLGLPVEVSEPFVIPPEQAALSLEIQVPEQCSELREGSVVRFQGEADGDVGSPVFQPGEFIVGYSGVCVLDDTPPQVEQFTAVPLQDGSLNVRVAATDEITLPIDALLRFQVDGAPEEQISMGFDDPPVIGDSVFFRKIIGPFPQGSVIEVTTEVFDDVGNSVVAQPTEPDIIQVDIDIKPGSDPNCVNPTSGGRIAVAILGSSIDATIIDVSTIRISDPDPATALIEPVRSSFKDVDNDSRADLVLHFSTPALNEAGLLVDGNTLFVTGALTNSTEVVGSDIIFLAGGPNCFD